MSTIKTYPAINTPKNWFLLNVDSLKSKTSGFINESDLITKKRQEAIKRLDSITYPNIRMEEYRYTDFRKLERLSLATPEPHKTEYYKKKLNNLNTSKESIKIVIVDGLFVPDLSYQSSPPRGLHIGNFSKIRSKKNVARQLSFYDRLTSSRGTPFALFNSATVKDVFFIIAEPGFTLAGITLHLLIMSSGSTEDSTVICSSAPRIFIWVGENASLEVIEEYVSMDKGCHFTNSVTEFYLSRDAKVLHRYLQMESQSNKSYHVKSTLVDQEEASSYECTEVGLGGHISRHDLSIYQRGSDTRQVLGHFLLAGKNQLHDLHCKLRFCHKNGKAEQLHKCIAAHHSSRGVFDGNFEIKRNAAKTDARQLSRNLLISPSATVNIKPNLQIAADDVKCAHGCTVSDLILEEIFYFASRGIDKRTAREALVYSFGSEIVGRLDDPSLEKRINRAIKSQLASSYLD